jgi:hypothetical protein
MKNAYLTLGCLLSIYTGLGQNPGMIKFSAENSSSPANRIKLTIQNISSDSTFYFYIDLQAIVDTGIVWLISDIKSLGQKESLILEPIKQKSKLFYFVSRETIRKNFPKYSKSKLIFTIVFYRQHGFIGKYETIQAKPL